MPSTIPPQRPVRPRPPGRYRAAGIGLQADPLLGRTSLACSAPSTSSRSLVRRWLRTRSPVVVILLPATWLLLTAGLLGAVALATLVGGGMPSVTALFLLGLAVAASRSPTARAGAPANWPSFFTLAAPMPAAQVWCQHLQSVAEALRPA
ncbi:hypothetical protein ACWD26_01260 [Streptomyces sp. NPDC002787]